MNIDGYGYDRSYSSMKALYVNAHDKAYTSKRWVIHNEFGYIAIVFANNEQDALDIVVDESTKLDSCQAEDNDEMYSAEHSYMYSDHCALGNAGELFDLSYVGMKQI
tara:strand:- start:523 stop:843 length:321 start_codon:yes stop_codon:yes gene_type:complete